MGATERDIIHVRHYVVKESGDVQNDKKPVVLRGWNEVWMEYMEREAGGHKPPGTAFGVASLAASGLLYEVEVLVIVHN